jgi:hypothetical protein
MDRLLPGVSPLGYVDHRDFGTLGVSLAFGRRPDGSVVHISEVERGLACGCVCPACGIRIVANKRKRQHHFKHHRNSSGCTYGPETNAHYFAKLLLERVRWITLPERRVTVDGVTHLIQPATRFEFDEVVVEQRLGQIVPDLMAVAKGRRLLVEVFVTHKCDDDKIAYLVSNDLSAIEVDLSAYRSSMDDEAIAEGLLAKAPRTWLHNRLAEADKRKVRDLAEADKKRVRDHLAAEKRVAAAAAEHHARQILEAIAAAKIEVGRLDVEVDTVRILGRDHLIGIGTEVAGFGVPTVDWQALLLVSTVIQPSREGSASFPITADAARVHLQECIIPELREPLPPEVERSLLELQPSVVLPTRGIGLYLDCLVRAEVIEHRDAKVGKVFNVRSAEKVDLRRRIAQYHTVEKNEGDANRRLHSILSRLTAADLSGFDLTAWRASVPGFGMSLTEICADGEAWERFASNLHTIEVLLRGGVATTSWLGLPLTRLVTEARKAEISRQEQAAQREAAKRQQERDDRIANMHEAARRALGPEADNWLNHVDASGLTRVESAAEGGGIVDQLHAELETLRETRQRRLKEEATADACREKLRAAAKRAFGVYGNRADLFLRSAHPRLSARSPLDYCRNEATLGLCLRLLPGQPGTRRARR